MMGSELMYAVDLFKRSMFADMAPKLRDETLLAYTSECVSLPEGERMKEETAHCLCDMYDTATEDYMEMGSLVGGLHCLNNCRKLYNAFPHDARVAFTFLQTITGLVYTKIQRSEDGMVEEYMDEALDVADRVPEDVDVQRQAARCMANLVALCGGFDAPLSLAYAGVERMEKVANRFPQDSELRNVYAHILVSACYFANRTHNEEKLERFYGQIEKLEAEEPVVIDRPLLRAHLRQVGIYRWR